MIRKLAIATALVFALVVTASAQPKPQTSITINIPFEFALGSRILPAGTYKLQAVLGAPTEADHMSVMALRNLEGNVYQAVVTDVADGEAKMNSTLVFAYFHGQRFLSQVWLAGQRLGLSLHIPPSEGHFAQNVAVKEPVELSELTGH